MAKPVLVKPVPPQTINELASYGPFDLKNFIQAPEGSQPPRFSAELTDGKPFPKGMICTGDGIVTGIPAKGTQGVYEVMVTAENDAGKVTTTFAVTIKPSLVNREADYLEKL